MQKLIMAITLIIGMFYALTVQAIGPERDTPTAILTLQQITTPTNPPSGFNRIYSKGDDKLYTLNSAGEEVELGAGGAGSGRLNLLEDPSFEDGVAEGSCILCTAAEELTVVLATLNNAKSLKLTQTSGLGAYTLNKTTGSEYLATQVAASCYIKTSATGIQFKALSNAAPVVTREVSSDGNWNEYIIPFVAGTTSIGYQVTGGAASDVIYVDECFLGAKDVLNKVGYDTGWESCGLTASDFQGVGTPTNIEIDCKRDGSDLLMRGNFTTGTTTGVEFRMNLKSGLVSASTIDTLEFAGGGVTNGSAVAGRTIHWLIEPSATYVTAGYGDNTRSFLSKDNGNGLFASSTNTGVFVRIPIQGWQATFDSISDIGGGSNVRLDTANGYGSTATNIRRFSNTRTNIGSSLNCVDSATNGFSCTVLRSGFYFVSYSDGFNSAAYQGISLNATSLTTGIQALAANEMLAMNYQTTANTFTLSSWNGWLWAGDIVRPHTNGDAVGSFDRTSFSMVGLLDQISAILKDVLMSPSSSNGKPVFYSFYVTDGAGTTTISRGVGDLSTGVCTNTSAGTYTCPIKTDHPILNCSCDIDVLSDGTCVAVEASGTINVEINNSGVKTDRNFKMFCHGVAP